MKIPTQKGEHSCKCTELSLYRKEGIEQSIFSRCKSDLKLHIQQFNRCTDYCFIQLLYLFCVSSSLVQYRYIRFGDIPLHPSSPLSPYISPPNVFTFHTKDHFLSFSSLNFRLFYMKTPHNLIKVFSVTPSIDRDKL